MLINNVKDKTEENKFTADDLGDRLWGGFSNYALPALLQLKEDPSTTHIEREKAIWQLIRWFYFEKKYSQAYENIIFIEKQQRILKKKFRIAKLLCLIKLGRFNDANRAIDCFMKYHVLKAIIIRIVEELEKFNLLFWLTRYIKRRLEEVQNLYLLKSTIMRNLAFEDNNTQFEIDKIQLRWLNKYLKSANLVSIKKKDHSRSLGFSNITATASPWKKEQKKRVSIIMPAFNARKTIHIALQSLLAQSWKNIEIIVVDDCSTDDTCEIVKKFISQDSRIKLIQKPENEGPYAARNMGLQYVTGDLVTVHDSDDWSHPQKIEFQLDLLSKRKNCVAVLSYFIRVDDSLEIIGPWTVKDNLTDLNFSSLMVWKEVIGKLGIWDKVRAGADAEFRNRILKYYGPDSIITVQSNHILSFSLVREDSLVHSKETHKRSSAFGLRWQYKDACHYWHSQENFKSNPRLQENNRFFPVPRGLFVNKAIDKYDLLVISDFATNDKIFESILSYIVTSCNSGEKLAVFQWPDYINSVQKSLNPKLYDAAVKYDIDILTPNDSVEVKLVLVGCPAILHYMIDNTPKISTRKVVVINNQSEMKLIKDPNLKYDPQIVRKHLVKLFGMECKWILKPEDIKTCEGNIVHT